MSDLLDHLKPFEPFNIQIVSISAMRSHPLLKSYVGLMHDLNVHNKNFIYLKCNSTVEMDKIKWDIKRGALTGHNRWDRIGRNLLKSKKFNCLHHQREYRPRKCK